MITALCRIILRNVQLLYVFYVLQQPMQNLLRDNIFFLWKSPCFVLNFHTIPLVSLVLLSLYGRMSDFIAHAYRFLIYPEL